MTTDLPPDLTAFAALLDAQPEPVRAAFNYCLALAMVEAGKARLVETQPGEAGTICVFESSAGERFSLARPSMSEEMEERVLEAGYTPWGVRPRGGGCDKRLSGTIRLSREE